MEHAHRPRPRGVDDGATSPLVLLARVLTAPALFGFLALVAVIAFLLPFLPDRHPDDY